MGLLKQKGADLDSTLLANNILQELESVDIVEENIRFTKKQLDMINRGCLSSARKTAAFSEKMIQMMEMEHFDFTEDFTPTLEDEKEIVDIDIPIKSLFEKLSDYVCIALAS